MGEAKRREDEEAQARREWARDVLDEVQALEVEAAARVLAERGTGPENAVAFPSPDEAARIGTLLTLAVVRSIGFDAAGIAAAIDAAAGDDEDDDEDDRPLGSSRRPAPFSLVTPPKSSNTGILPE